MSRLVRLSDLPKRVDWLGGLSRGELCEADESLIRVVGWDAARDRKRFCWLLNSRGLRCPVHLRRIPACARFDQESLDRVGNSQGWQRSCRRPAVGPSGVCSSRATTVSAAYRHARRTADAILERRGSRNLPGRSRGWFAAIRSACSTGSRWCNLRRMCWGAEHAS